MAHYYYCPFHNCNDQQLKNTEYRYAVKYGDPAYAYLDSDFYKSKEAGRHDSVVIKTNVYWTTRVVNGASALRPAYVKRGVLPLAILRSDDVLIVNGHGARGSESLYTTATADGGGITAVNLAVQLAMDGLKRGHVYIKLAACYSGGGFDGDEHKVLARALAMALGSLKWDPENRRHDKDAVTGAYRKIRVGGFQGKLQIRKERQVENDIDTGVRPTPSTVVGKAGEGGRTKDILMPARHKLLYFDAGGNLCSKVPLKVDAPPASDWVAPSKPVANATPKRSNTTPKTSPANTVGGAKVAQPASKKLADRIKLFEKT